MRRAWTIDVAIDELGLPYALFQARANDSNLDHRFFYARFDGSAWSVNEIAKAGGYLYAAEDDYTGLAVRSARPESTVHFECALTRAPTSSCPTTRSSRERRPAPESIGTGNQSRSIRRSTTCDRSCPPGTPTTRCSAGPRGNYSTYTNYDLDIVGLTNITAIVPQVAGDLNGDGVLDAADATAYMNGLHADLSSLSFEQGAAAAT